MMACSYSGRNKRSLSEDGPNDSPGSVSDSRRHELLYNSSCPPTIEDDFGSFHEGILQETLLSQEWTSQDPELMHHFTLYTSKSLARRPEMQETWQVYVPQIAYSYEFLTHGILALSAVHLAQIRPEKYSQYLTKSRFHISLGLRSFRRVLLSPTPENCCALFAFSSLIMVYTYASPAESSDIDNPNTLETVLSLFKLCRGTLSLRPYMHLIQGSPLGPLFRQEYFMEIPTAT